MFPPLVSVYALSAASALFALLSLDRSVGPFFLGRPLVLGPAVGYLVGDPFSGWLAGTLAELIWMDQLPLTPGRWDAGFTAALAAYLAAAPGASSGGERIPSLGVSFLAATMAGGLSALMDQGLLWCQGRWTAAAEKELDHGSDRGYWRAVATSLAVGFLARFVLFWVCGMAGRRGLFILLAAAPDGVREGLRLLNQALPVFGFSVAATYFFRRARPDGFFNGSRTP
jgi:mannose/fructose/N-acetylgalactosamine-specific phosphotransferase system component IIC